jgi:hypothetical protein
MIRIILLLYQLSLLQKSVTFAPLFCQAVFCEVITKLFPRVGKLRFPDASARCGTFRFPHRPVPFLHGGKVHRLELGKLLIGQFRAVLVKNNGIFFRFFKAGNLLRG